MSKKIIDSGTAEIIRLNENQILKLFYKSYTKCEVEREYKNTQIVHQLGCSPVEALQLINQDGRYGIVMNYIKCTPQNDIPKHNPFYIFKGGRDLARCHVFIQRKKSHELPDVRKLAVDALKEKTFDDFSSQEKDLIKQYVMSLLEEDGVLHLDLHTGNVMFKAKNEYFAIDWMTAARGNRAIEYAMMDFLLNDSWLFPEKSKLQNFFFARVRRLVAKQFYKEYQRLTPISFEEVDRYRIIALVIRRSGNVPCEQEKLAIQIRNLIKKYCH